MSLVAATKLLHVSHEIRDVPNRALFKTVVDGQWRHHNAVASTREWTIVTSRSGVWFWGGGANNSCTSLLHTDIITCSKFWELQLLWTTVSVAAFTKHWAFERANLLVLARLGTGLFGQGRASLCLCC